MTTIDIVELIEKNPAQFLKLPKISKQKGKTEALSEEEIKFIINSLKEENILLKSKLNQILSMLGKNNIS